MYIYMYSSYVYKSLYSFIHVMNLNSDNPHSKPPVAALHRKSLVAVSERDFHEGNPLWPLHTVNPMWLSVCEAYTREEGSSGCEGKGKTPYWAIGLPYRVICTIV